MERKRPSRKTSVSLSPEVLPRSMKTPSKRRPSSALVSAKAGKRLAAARAAAAALRVRVFMRAPFGLRSPKGPPGAERAPWGELRRLGAQIPQRALACRAEARHVAVRAGDHHRAL